MEKCFLLIILLTILKKKECQYICTKNNFENKDCKWYGVICEINKSSCQSNNCKDCLNCLDGTYCETCKSGYKHDSRKKICFLEAQDNQYNHQSEEVDLICHQNCLNCSFPPSSESMNCITCKENLYKMNGTDNCYDVSIINKGYYFKDNLFYQCDENCLTCSEGKNETSNNCLSCDNSYESLYLLEDKNNCEKSNFTGYYLNAEDKILKKCHESCKICNGPYEIDSDTNIENHNCIECADNYYKLENGSYQNNCYDNDTINLWKNTEEINLTINFNSSINTYFKFESNENINVDSTINQNNNELPTYLSKNESIKDNIKQFKNEIISNFNVSEKKDIIESKDNFTFQMTTSENQKNNINKSISSIDLGDCEDILKGVYNISLPLIIFKIDYFSGDSLIPIIGYEIYHPISKEKLNLSHCEEILIKLNIPVNIDESKLYRYDPNSEYYTDNCFSYTTENGTDIIISDRKKEYSDNNIISDRKKEYSDNNLALCQNDCIYTGYNQNDKQSVCDCSLKNKMDLISEIIDNDNPIQLSNDFDKKNSDSSSSSGASNIISIKCTKALFSKEGLKNNISSYIQYIKLYPTYFHRSYFIINSFFY